MTEEPRYDIERPRLRRAARAHQEGIHRSRRVCSVVRAGRVPRTPRHRRGDARVGGLQRFVMVSEADPSVRTGFTGSFTEVVDNQLLASSGSWDGIPGQVTPGRHICGSSSMTRTARPGSCCAKVHTPQARRRWVVGHGR